MLGSVSIGFLTMDQNHLQRGQASQYHSRDFEFETVVPAGGLEIYLESVACAASASGGSASAAAGAAHIDESSCVDESREQRGEHSAQPEALEGSTLPPICTSDKQAGEWDVFHTKTNGRFFKPRMFLLLEFPCLSQLSALSTPPTAAQLTESTACDETADAFSSMSSSNAKMPALPAVWEVGCGAGSNVLPLLHHTPTPLRVFASDYSASAVATLQEHPDFDSARCSAFVLDVVKGGLHAGCTAAQELYPLGVQAVTATFVLSAIHPCEQLHAVASMAGSLAPGGFLCFRDYGE